MIIKGNEPLKEYTTYRIGGKANLLIMPETVEELREVLQKYGCMKVFVLGNGSNVLVKDTGFSGCVINPMFKSMRVCGERMIVQAGALVCDMIAFARFHNLMGVEILAGIPGSLGGVIAMNAGFTKAVSTIVESVRVMDHFGQIKTLTNEEMKFGYRTSIVHREELVVIDATLRVSKGDNRLIVSEYLELRRKRQPINYASCGSVFRKNNLKDFQGWTSGNAQVKGSYIVNLGEATSDDVLSLIDRITEASKVKPELEVKVLGD